jgi:hypothetical protein
VRPERIEAAPFGAASRAVLSLQFRFDKEPYGIEMALSSIVTAPFRARALPDRLAPVPRLTLVSAMMFPLKAVPVPSVAELPTCQYTFRAWLPPVITTDELLAVFRELAILKMNTELALPESVSLPVN